MQIHQLVPALHEGDATGDSVLALRDYLRDHGYESNIYAYTIDEGVAGEAIPFDTTHPRVDTKDLLILHFAIPSDMTDFLKQAECKKAIIYHNITPSYFWLPYDRNMVHLASTGRKELESLAPFVERSAGVSEYNRQELERLAYRNTCVLPLYIKRERYQTSPSPFVLEWMNDGLFNFVFVGRVVPNKKFEDIIKLFFFFKRLYEPLSRVIFVGKPNVTPTYKAALIDLIGHLGLMAEDIVFTGHVDWSELVAYYRSSHVFISMSEHEGFCLPFIEAMICNTPIVAYSCAAVPHVLGNAGIQFTEKNFIEIAGICHRLREDKDFREIVLGTQRKQLEKYSKEETEKAIQEFLAPLL